MNMRPLLLSALVTVAICHHTHAADNPKSKKTHWRIPPNAAVTSVGHGLDWNLVELSDGRLTLTAGLAEHHSYEQAWAYYTKIFGMETSYNASNKRQERVVDGDRRSMREHDKDHVFKAGRWAVMFGKFGRYKTTLSLYDDPTLNKTHRVYVNIVFDPK